jgi:hypothetical protein
MVRLLPLLILIVQIVTIIDVVKSNRDTERKVLWILGIIFLPLLGSLAWYLVSRNVLK